MRQFLLDHPLVWLLALMGVWCAWALIDAHLRRKARDRVWSKVEERQREADEEWNAMARRTSGLLAPKPTIDTVIITGVPVDDVKAIRAAFDRPKLSSIDPICPRCHAAIGAWGLCDCDAGGMP